VTWAGGGGGGGAATAQARAPDARRVPVPDCVAFCRHGGAARGGERGTSRTCQDQILLGAQDAVSTDVDGEIRAICEFCVLYIYIYIYVTESAV
jgi:hypothetical protein